MSNYWGKNKKQKQKMVSFTLNSDFLMNLYSFCSANLRDYFIDVIFGEEKATIPSEVLASISKYFHNTLISDSTIRTINLDDVVKVNFRNNSTKSTIMKLLSDNTYTKQDLSEEDIFDFFEFGISIGCNLFMKPLIDKYERQNTTNYENEPIQNILSIISNKIILHNNSYANINYDEELTFVSKNLYQYIDKQEFIEWCLDHCNYNAVEQIISNDNVHFNSEDSLLNFILLLSQHSESFINLLRYVLFEYCSISCISNFITFVKKRIEETNSREEILLLFECLSRRCIKERNKKITEVIYNSNNPKNGIFGIEYRKQNVLLEASSDNNPNSFVYTLTGLFVKMDDNYSFATQDILKSSITATIKDNKSFIVNKYMIRGNDSNHDQIKSWKIEGLLASTNKWITLDTHQNETPLNKYEVKTFDIESTEPLRGIKLTQTGPNSSNCNHLYISGFDVYGQIISEYD